MLGRHAAPMLLMTLAAAPVHGQCQPEWLDSSAGPDGRVYVLATYNGDLIAGGEFNNAGGLPAANIARWDGANWSALGAGTSGPVAALTVSNGILIVGGGFLNAGGQPASRLARWNGASWAPLGDGVGGYVHALAAMPGAVVAGGSFTSAGLQPARGLASWDGSSWSAIDIGPASATPTVRALLREGGDLVVGGEFFYVATGGSNAFLVRLVGGASFGSEFPGSSSLVTALVPYNGGIAVGGSYAQTPSGPANHISHLQGINAYTPMGTGLGGNCYAVAVHNGQLFAGGSFATAGGQPAVGVARWNGVAWSSVGSGIGGGGFDPVYALHSHNGELIVGGEFTAAGGLTASNWARWGCACYANCDNSSIAPVLNVLDFNCFLNAFASGAPYANCDHSAVAPVLNVLDFNCFLNAFAAGCP